MLSILYKSEAENWFLRILALPDLSILYQQINIYIIDAKNIFVKQSIMFQYTSAQNHLSYQKKKRSDSLGKSATFYDYTQKYISWPIKHQTNELESKGNQLFSQLTALHNKLTNREFKADSSTIADQKYENKVLKNIYVQNSHALYTYRRFINKKHEERQNKNTNIQVEKILSNSKRQILLSKDQNNSKEPSFSNKKLAHIKVNNNFQTNCNKTKEYKNISYRYRHNSQSKALNTLRKQINQSKRSAIKSERSKQQYCKQLANSKKNLKYIRKIVYNHQKVIDNLQKQLNKSKNLRNKQKNIISKQREQLNQLRQILKQTLQLNKYVS